MSKGLKIYACSGVGDIRETTPDKLEYELEDTSTVSNTRAMNIILSIMNDIRSQVKYDGAMAGSNGLNRLDVYSVAFYFARLYRGKEDMLLQAGQCIQKLLNSGKFVSDTTDLQQHSGIVDGYIDDITAMLESGDSFAEESGTFLSWWNEYVVGMDEVDLPKELQLVANECLNVPGVSGTKDKYGIDSDSDLSKYLNDGAEYFLYYILFSEEEVKKLNYIIRKKWKKQKETYDYCVNCFVGIYGTEETMVRIINCGIRETFGCSIGEVKTSILQGKNVGAITSAVASIIVAVISAVVAIITAICTYAAKVQAAKYTAPASVESGIADASDYWDEESSSNTATNASSKWLAVGLAAVGLGTYFMQGKNKKK